VNKYTSITLKSLRNGLVRSLNLKVLTGGLESVELLNPLVIARTINQKCSNEPHGMALHRFLSPPKRAYISSPLKSHPEETSPMHKTTVASVLIHSNQYPAQTPTPESDSRHDSRRATAKRRKKLKKNWAVLHFERIFRVLSF